MNIIYMGTPDFAVPALKKLYESKHTVQAVFTQPDKPKGRKMVLTPPDVKVCAQELNIPVYQPTTFKSEEPLEIIKKYNPDVIVVAAYGKLLPKAVLESAKYGVTAMQMAEGLDTGDILTVIETKIGENETSGELFDRLSILGGELIIKTLEMLENGEIKPVKQDESKATHTSKIDKSFCPIDFTKSAYEVHNKVRGLNPWPIATAELNGKKLKIYSTKVCEKSGKAGTIISIKPLIVACGSGSVEIIELQPEGKKRMPSAAFLAGHKLNIGDSFN